MRYEGDEKILAWQGKMEIHQGKPFLFVVNDKGEDVHFAIFTGMLVPENWIKKNVKISIELLGD